MNSLVNYGSDDDLDDSPEEKLMDSYGTAGRNYRKPGAQHDDTNYDEVQMSLSEDSDAETRSSSKYSRERDNVRRSSPKTRENVRDGTQRERRDDRSDRDKLGGKERNDDKSKFRDDDRARNRDDKDDKNKNRDDDRTRDKADRYRDDDKSRDRRDDRRDRYSSRDDRYRQDRDRKSCRSPRDNRDRERRRSRSPRRSRSRSRDRIGRGGFQRRFDRGNRMDKNDQKNNSQELQQNDVTQKDRFFMPGITGRFRDQIEKRKLLWQKKEAVTVPTMGSQKSLIIPQNTNAQRSTKVWEGTTFAQDTDGKVANKFKRLMGIKTPTEGNKSVDVLKKQDEMFNAMEQQYEVARTTTHTMRGVGLGFNSYNR